MWLSRGNCTENVNWMMFSLLQSGPERNVECYEQ
jgi:hypothetical protein